MRAVKAADYIGHRVVFVSGGQATAPQEITGLDEDGACFLVGDRRVPTYCLQFPTMGGYPGPDLNDHTYLVFEGDDQPGSLHEAVLFSVIDSAMQFGVSITRQLRLARLERDYLGYFVKDGLVTVLVRQPVRVRGKMGHHGIWIGSFAEHGLSWPYLLDFDDRVTAGEVTSFLRLAGLKELDSAGWKYQGIARRAVRPHFVPA